MIEAFRGKSVLLTGHTGFKGSWLALWLHRLGAKVHGYALTPPTVPSLFEEAKVEEVLASHTIGDVRDFAALSAAVARAKPEVVLHLAAQPLVRLSYREPRETFETNVMGTVNVLEAVRGASGVRVVQIVTSDKCYENREWVYAYREADAMGGYDPYSASKGCAELVVGAMRRSFFHPGKLGQHGVSVSSARAGNVIGGGDWAEDRIIPDCVRALMKGESILVRNPHAIRPWQHVLEPLSGYLGLAARQLDARGADSVDFADAYNFGPSASDNVPVRAMVEQACKLWGDGKWHTDAAASSESTHHEAMFLKLDVTKAATFLGWKPRLTVDEAIGETVSWYQRRAAASNGKSFSARAMCLEQIARYEARMSQGS